MPTFQFQNVENVNSLGKGDFFSGADGTVWSIDLDLGERIFWVHSM